MLRDFNFNFVLESNSMLITHDQTTKACMNEGLVECLEL